MRSLLAVCACVCMCRATTLYRVDVDADLAREKEALCLDGSYPIFFADSTITDQTTSRQDKRNWIIFFEGGGWCHTLYDCYSRSQIDLGTGTHSSRQEVTIDGLLSDDCNKNKEFCGYTKVMLHYCDGNSFSGDQEGPTFFNGDQLYFRGKAVREALLETLLDYGLRGAENVVLSGCSAGGLASILHSDSVRDFLYQHARGLKKYGVVPLSGFFLDAANTYGEKQYGMKIKGTFDMSRAVGGVHQGCIEKAPAGEEWKCNMAPYVYPHIQSPIFVVDSVYDSWQLPNIFLSGVFSSRIADLRQCISSPERSCDAVQSLFLNTYPRQMLDVISSTPTSRKPGNGVFLDSCNSHCSGNSNQFFNVQVEGLSVYDAVANWWSGRSDGQDWKFPCLMKEGQVKENKRQCNPTCLLPKPSKLECSGHGVLDINTERCTCDTGYHTSPSAAGGAQCTVRCDGEELSRCWDTEMTRPFLLLSMVDSRKKMFPNDFKTLRVQNAEDPEAETHSIIGLIGEPDSYRDSSGKFVFLLELEYISGKKEYLMWKQSSWLTEPLNIPSYEPITVPHEAKAVSQEVFHGLGPSDVDHVLLDGNGRGNLWWNAVGVTHAEGFPAVPSFDLNFAYLQRLSVFKPNCQKQGRACSGHANCECEGLKLILSMANSKEELFPRSFLSTAMWNSKNPESNTYSIIGKIDEQHLRNKSDKFTFRLELTFSDGGTETISWKQKSWLLDGAIEGYEPLNVPDQTDPDLLSHFKGLGRSYTTVLLDGNGEEPLWWNGVGAVELEGFAAVPSFNKRLAIAQRLYLVAYDVNLIPCGRIGCSEHGLCDGNSDTCECDKEYFSYDCSVHCKAETTCNGHGVCGMNGSCDCSIGWAGYRCEIKATLLLSMVSSKEELFPRSFLSTAMWNSENPESNTYSIIGKIDEQHLRNNSDKFTFRLELTFSDGSTEAISWKQKSWLLDGAIEGYEPLNVPDQTDPDLSSHFKGLGRSDTEAVLLDGNGEETHWWNGVGAVDLGHYSAVPSLGKRLAITQRLYLVADDVKLIL